MFQTFSPPSQLPPEDIVPDSSLPRFKRSHFAALRTNSGFPLSESYCPHKSQTEDAIIVCGIVLITTPQVDVEVLLICLHLNYGNMSEYVAVEMTVLKYMIPEEARIQD